MRLINRRRFPIRRAGTQTNNENMKAIDLSRGGGGERTTKKRNAPDSPNATSDRARGRGTIKNKNRKAMDLTRGGKHDQRKTRKATDEPNAIFDR